MAWGVPCDYTRPPMQRRSFVLLRFSRGQACGAMLACTTDLPIELRAGHLSPPAQTTALMKRHSIPQQQQHPRCSQGSRGQDGCEHARGRELQWQEGARLWQRPAQRGIRGAQKESAARAPLCQLRPAPARRRGHGSRAHHYVQVQADRGRRPSAVATSPPSSKQRSWVSVESEPDDSIGGTRRSAGCRRIAGPADGNCGSSAVE